MDDIDLRYFLNRNPAFAARNPGLKKSISGADTPRTPSEGTSEPTSCQKPLAPVTRAGKTTPSGESEKGFQRCVIELAHLLGYMVAHFRHGRITRDGQEIYVVPVGADGKGFPDLVLVGRGRVIFAELKSKKGRLSPEQKIWIETLEANGAEVHVWRPADFETVKKVLE